jgi:hypothetical protein
MAIEWFIITGGVWYLRMLRDSGAGIVSGGMVVELVSGVAFPSLPVDLHFRSLFILL